MKQSARIAVSLVLSLLVVWMGAGIVLVHCCHTEKTTIVGMTGDCDDDCAPVSDCMKPVVLALSPVSKVVADIPVFHSPLFCAAPYLLTVLPEVPQALPDDATHAVPRRFESPRAYLSFLRTLRI